MCVLIQQSKELKRPQFKKPAPLLARGFKRTSEEECGFINIVCPFWEKARAKAIWHHTTVGSQTDEQSLLKISKNYSMFICLCLLYNHLLGPEKPMLLKRFYAAITGLAYKRRHSEHTLHSKLLLRRPMSDKKKNSLRLLTGAKQNEAMNI